MSVALERWQQSVDSQPKAALRAYTMPINRQANGLGCQARMSPLFVSEGFRD
jgi:hypothetical protein